MMVLLLTFSNICKTNKVLVDLTIAEIFSVRYFYSSKDCVLQWSTKAYNS